jgi:hypothetical protein
VSTGLWVATSCISEKTGILEGTCRHRQGNPSKNPSKAGANKNHEFSSPQKDQQINGKPKIQVGAYKYYMSARPPAWFSFICCFSFLLLVGDVQNRFFLAQNICPIIGKHARFEPTVPMLEGA